MSKIKLPPYIKQPQNNALPFIQEWLEFIYRRIGNGPFMIKGYSTSSLPEAAAWASSAGDFSSLIYVYDETGGATVAFSDGTNWRRVQDRAVVS